jgi:hypothetical protein
VKDSPGCHLLQADIQGKLMELLGSAEEDAGEEEEALSRFLVLLLSKGVDRATIEQEVMDVMPEDLGPSFVAWCASRRPRAAGRALICCCCAAALVRPCVRSGAVSLHRIGRASTHGSDRTAVPCSARLSAASALARPLARRRRRRTASPRPPSRQAL